ncbi:hypothetical protein [Streptomyces sp. TRM68416]|uniref:hypothetical protein n=1 Tax=Streptomyces sp. TRM68416 TaxID=2758412 RepID=UPI0016619821|nr:hypothetical protein [Streptomyces sp. TRM68416]MBD0840331.1 hypothetical protein [Streptomyces sp. TRM68416]
MTATLTATSAGGDRSGWVVRVVVLAAEGVPQGVDDVALETEPDVGVDGGGDKSSLNRRIFWLAITGPIGLLLAFVVNGNLSASAMLVYGCVCAVWLLYLWVSWSIMRRLHLR